MQKKMEHMERNLMFQYDEAAQERLREIGTSSNPKDRSQFLRRTYLHGGIAGMYLAFKNWQPPPPPRNPTPPPREKTPDPEYLEWLEERRNPRPPPPMSFEPDPMYLKVLSCWPHVRARVRPGLLCMRCMCHTGPRMRFSTHTNTQVQCESTRLWVLPGFSLLHSTGLGHK